MQGQRVYLGKNCFNNPASSYKERFHQFSFWLTKRFFHQSSYYLINVIFHQSCSFFLIKTFSSIQLLLKQLSLYQSSFYTEEISFVNPAASMHFKLRA